jgi:signal transduction histidine kinase
VKETLNNIVRHARATETWLRVATSDEALVLVVEDNGQGFERPREDPGADGLRNMRQRMEEIGGEVKIESRPGLGTRVSFIYPWPKRSRSVASAGARASNGHTASRSPFSSR